MSLVTRELKSNSGILPRYHCGSIIKLEKDANTKMEYRV